MPLPGSAHPENIFYEACVATPERVPGVELPIQPLGRPIDLALDRLEGRLHPTDVGRLQRHVVELAVAQEERLGDSTCQIVDRGAFDGERGTKVRRIVAGYAAGALVQRLIEGKAVIPEAQLARNIIRQQGMLLSGEALSSQGYDPQEVCQRIMTASMQFTAEWLGIQDPRSWDSRFVPLGLSGYVYSTTRAPFAVSARRAGQLLDDLKGVPIPKSMVRLITKARREIGRRQ